jgi:deoxyribodipyrimidine photo-lyase
MPVAPTLYWVRRDFRLTDNPALLHALSGDGPMIPVFLVDEVVEALGVAPKWRMGLAAACFDTVLRDNGSRLVVRKGRALDTLRSLVAETGATRVIWQRAYTADQIERDKTVKASLVSDGVQAESVQGHLLFEPWSVETGTGGFYKVYTPFWKAVAGRSVDASRPAPGDLKAPEPWPASLDPAALEFGRAMNRGADIVRPHLAVGEAAALDRLDRFLEARIGDYDRTRDLPGEIGTSRLSENLAYGEIGPRRVWAAAHRALEEGKRGAETFLKELVWREFAYHLSYHTPHIAERNWRPEWDGFPWQDDNEHAEAWRRGRTGVRFVDAGMRELYITGTMHNRARMIVASYLTKHLLTDWRVGLSWFEQCLVDWDPASNAMGWQWAAGSGPDAAPYFRIFNPDTQLEKFDKAGAYVKAYLAEGQPRPSETALSFFEACPRSWAMAPSDRYPQPIVPLDRGRKRALEAYAAHRDR